MMWPYPRKIPIYIHIKGDFIVSKQKLTYIQKKKLENQVNKKAIIWVSSITAAFLITLTILVLVNH
jgi:hypothetical protein